MVRDEFLRVNTEKYIRQSLVLGFGRKTVSAMAEREHALLCWLSNKPPGPEKLKPKASTTKVADQG
jgi:hypothetical protein